MRQRSCVGWSCSRRCWRGAGRVRARQPRTGRHPRGIDGTKHTRCRWWRAPRRMRPWSPSSVSTCPTAAWTSPSPSWPCWMGPRRCVGRFVDVFDHPVIARCQLHKIRNVQDHLPEKMRSTVGSKIRAAYHADFALQAQSQLEALARELERTHPSAHPPQHQQHREHDLDLPRTRQKRQALAGRDDGAALVRGRNGRGRQAIPPRQRSHAPTQPARRARTRDRRKCQCHMR
jgi:mutator family transposase